MVEQCRQRNGQDRGAEEVQEKREERGKAPGKLREAGTRCAELQVPVKRVNDTTCTPVVTLYFAAEGRTAGAAAVHRRRSSL